MRLLWNSSVWLLGTLVASIIATAQRETVVYPQHYQTPSSSAINASSSSCITLSPSNRVVSFDYGTEVGGFPVFDVQSIADPVQIEAKYSEARDALDAPFADGPWTFSNELANTFRVETFNVTKPGQVKSYCLQGGLRWQRLQLLGRGDVKICHASIQSSNDRTAVDALPGHFECSNSLYNELWALGPRTIQQTCVANHTAPSTWGITEDGVSLRGQQPAPSVAGIAYSNYTMVFHSKIVRGGMAESHQWSQWIWPVLCPDERISSDSTFLNTNRTLVPPNTLVVGYGYNLVNQTSLPTGGIVHFPLSFDVKEGEWYQIATKIRKAGYSVQINNHAPLSIPLARLQTPSASIGGPPSLWGGTWAFGPYQDQAAYVKDVKVYAQNGTMLYQNSMVSESVLEEFGVMPNTESVCLDGAKRDRLVWAGDFTHTYRVISASTYRRDFLTGTLAFILERQALSGSYAGFFSISPAMGQLSKYTLEYGSFGLLDYQMMFLNAFAGYYVDFADDPFLYQHWNQAKKGVQALLPLVDDDSNLASPGSVPGAFFTGSSNGTAPSALFVYTLQRMANLASVVGEAQTASRWNSTANSITNAINNQLWNNKLGTYGESLTSQNEPSFTCTAFTILAGIANNTQAQKAIEALSSLRLGIGYKTLSSMTNSATTQLSPNLSGILLEALLKHSRSSTSQNNATAEAIDVLINHFWAAMVKQDEYYTGTTWEYFYPDGKPGLDLYTSHAHPWGAAPTYVFTEYVLGIQATTPGFAEWAFQPAVLNLGLTWAKGRVPTPHGVIHGSWRFADKKTLDMKICAPKWTKGIVSLPFKVNSYTLNGERGDATSDRFEVNISGGGCSSISVQLP